MELDHRYTWVLPRKAWYIRVYLALWQTSPEDITFCKLFWGYALAWLAILVWMILLIPLMIHGGFCACRRRLREPKIEVKSVEQKAKPAPKPRIKVSRAVAGRRTRLRCVNASGVSYWHYPDDYTDYGGRYGGLYGAKLEATHIFSSPGLTKVVLVCYDHDGVRQEITEWIPVHARPSIGVQVLDAVSSGFTGLQMFCSSVGSVIKRPFRTPLATRLARYSWYLVGAALLCGGLFGFGYVLVIGAARVDWDAVGNATATVVTNYGPPTLGVIAGTVALGLLFYGTIAIGLWAMLNTFVGRPVAKGTKRGALSFRNMMVIGYKSVKSNTCPRVVIDEGDE